MPPTRRSTSGAARLAPPPPPPPPPPLLLLLLLLAAPPRCAADILKWDGSGFGLTVASEGLGLYMPLLTADGYDAIVDPLRTAPDKKEEVDAVMRLVMLLLTGSSLLSLVAAAITGVAGERVVAQRQAHLPLRRSELVHRHGAAARRVAHRGPHARHAAQVRHQVLRHCARHLRQERHLGPELLPLRHVLGRAADEPVVEVH
jgi:hypothetical protein